MYQAQAHKALRENSSTSLKKQLLQRAQEEWNEWIIDILYIFFTNNFNIINNSNKKA